MLCRIPRVFREGFFSIRLLLNFSRHRIIINHLNKLSGLAICSITQPALFPYLGYYQLVAGADTFVSYTDVTFMKGKWVNRNRYLSKQGIVSFTLPLKNASSYKKICNTEIDKNRFILWRDKLIRGLSQVYSNCPYKNDTLEIIADTFSTQVFLLDEICHRSIFLVFKYIGLTLDLVPSSYFDNEDLGRVDRLIDICKQTQSTRYVNSIGGVNLYRQQDFDADGIQLSFLRSRSYEYRQHQMGKQCDFVANMSMIDILMNRSHLEIRAMLEEYDLIVDR